MVYSYLCVVFLACVCIFVVDLGDKRNSFTSLSQPQFQSRIPEGCGIGASRFSVCTLPFCASNILMAAILANTPRPAAL